MPYIKKTCPGCDGLGRVPNITWASLIPFNYAQKFLIRCTRCQGRGYVLSAWHDRRRMS